jgi:glucose uptake protein GlcU
MRPGSTVPHRPPYPMLATAVVLINAAVLTVLLFGPNGSHPNAVLTVIGMAVIAVGLVLLFLAAMRARGNRRPF